MLRENIRTTRDALPYETWEYVNELYHFTNEHAHNSHNRKNRYLFLDQVISRCEQINGMLGMNLSRDHAHRFLSLGRLIERADMATRIIDITTRFENHIKNQGSNSLLEQHLWTCLLKAISCFSSYRQYVGPEIENHQAINFIFKERTNPRSILFCLKGMRNEIQELKDNSKALKSIASQKFKNNLIKKSLTTSLDFDKTPSWTVVENKEIKISSSEIRNQRNKFRGSNQ